MNGRIAMLRSRRSMIAAMLAGALALGGCGIEQDTAPRDIPDGQRPDILQPPNNADAPLAGTDRVYLLAPAASSEPRQLRASSRDIGDSATQRLTSLFGARTVAEESARLRSAIPDSLQLISAALQADGTLVVDVSDELLGLSSSALIDALAQIVYTAAEVTDVQRVELRVNGARRQWPASDGVLQSEPLTEYDYAGFVESTQPAFPAIPSPAA